MKPGHPFDMYEDQLEELKTLALKDRIRGRPGSQCAMVWEVIDTYIAKVHGCIRVA